jgi:hypothetical protein
MKRLRIFTFFMFCLAIKSAAQQNHFIYIQSDNKQPFYLRWDKKIISSTISGYLIIPKLVDGTYTFNVGFPKNEWPEQTFTCTINKKDIGLLLKNFTDKGWGLFNLQTLDITMAAAKPEKPVVPVETKVDEFSAMLANVVNDPSIKHAATLPPPVSLQTDTTTATVEDTTAKIAPAVTFLADTLAVEADEAVKINSGIVKQVLQKTDSGQFIRYIDFGVNGGRADTIEITLPAFAAEHNSADSPTTVAVLPITANVTGTEENTTTLPVADLEKNVAPLPATVADSTVHALQKDDKIEKKDAQFLEIEFTPPAGEATKPANTDAANNSQPQTIMVNSDCRVSATDDDFLKLRKKMVSASGTDEMIAVAKKTFRSRCFSTEQIKNLGVLFLNDAGKYSFYDAAYPFVSDTHNYRLLTAQLTDPYYISRFKAMIRQ